MTFMEYKGEMPSIWDFLWEGYHCRHWEDRVLHQWFSVIVAWLRGESSSEHVLVHWLTRCFRQWFWVIIAWLRGESSSQRCPVHDWQDVFVNDSEWSLQCKEDRALQCVTFIDRREHFHDCDGHCIVREREDLHFSSSMFLISLRLA